jgi:hypothetical protein
VAYEFQLPLSEVLGWRGPLTYRQFLVLLAWIEIQYDRPSRTDYYLMAQTMEIRSVAGMFSKRRSVRMRDFVLDFGTRAKPKLSEQAKLELNKAVWRDRMKKTRMIETPAPGRPAGERIIKGERLGPGEEVGEELEN